MTTKLALGTVQFGMAYGVANSSGQIDKNAGKEILRVAKDAGMDTLDTAIAYGNSEQRLGEIGIEGWRVISKLPAMPADMSDVSGWVDELVDESLARLNIPHLAGLLLHRPLELLEENGPQLYDALIAQKRAGRVEKIGFSIYGPDELDQLFGPFFPDLIQAPFNIIDRRLFSSGWLSQLAQAGTEVHVRSSFLQGLLLMSPAQRPPKFARWQTLWNTWDKWLMEENVSAPAACLRFASSFPEIAKVVVGVDSVDQLRQLLASGDGPLPSVPDSLESFDIDLLNPAHWNNL